METGSDCWVQLTPSGDVAAILLPVATATKMPLPYAASVQDACTGIKGVTGDADEAKATYVRYTLVPAGALYVTVVGAEAFRLTVSTRAIGAVEVLLPVKV